VKIVKTELFCVPRTFLRFCVVKFHFQEGVLQLKVSPCIFQLPANLHVLAFVFHASLTHFEVDARKVIFDQIRRRWRILDHTENSGVTRSFGHPKKQLFRCLIQARHSDLTDICQSETGAKSRLVTVWFEPNQLWLVGVGPVVGGSLSLVQEVEDVTCLFLLEHQLVRRVITQDELGRNFDDLCAYQLGLGFNRG
jgi:hypothetical protein